MPAFPLASTFIVLDDKQRAATVAVGPTMYEDLDRNFAGFRGCTLIAEHTFDSDWPTWERHPRGDEILYLIAAKMELRLLDDGSESAMTMDTPGQSVVVPMGHWHTARIIEKATVLFITPGEGTENVVDPRESGA